MFEVGELSFLAINLQKSCSSLAVICCKRLKASDLFFALALMLPLYSAVAQQPESQTSPQFTIQGTVVDREGKPAAEALVRLQQKDVTAAVEIRTNSDGAFTFPRLSSAIYILSAEKNGLLAPAHSIVVPSTENREPIRLVLEDVPRADSGRSTSSSPSAEAMEFADKPNFSVAGVTDWTAAGGHGSDSTLRTSEALVRETVVLKPETPEPDRAGTVNPSTGTGEIESRLRATLTAAPGNSEANHELGAFYLRAGRYSQALPLLQASYSIDPGNRANEFDLALALKGAGDFSQASVHVKKLLAGAETADLHRVAGELDEKLGDPLAAVHEFELAVRMEPSEQNYFEWGSELIVHRAVWQANEVFEQGARSYPKSERMLAALGAALFAGARYDEAAQRFCDASDLNPGDTEPYIFMGKIEMAAPNPLPCVDPKLQHFAEQHPENALADYFYAMALWKSQGTQANPLLLQQVESLLKKAITADAKCAAGYLELGVLNFSQRNYPEAIDYYNKAIAADPQLADAHYRLGIAYDRTGEQEKAKKEFQLHDEIKKQQAAAVEQERRDVKQFLVVVPGHPTYPLPN